MSDAMFTFASHAIAVGHITGTFPGAGGARLTGGSPRYQLYPTRDGKLVACGALEQKFWIAFTAAIGLAGGVHRRPPRSGGDQIGGGGNHRRPQRGGMEAGSGEGRLLRHHRRDAGGGAARSAFHRPRIVRAQGFRRVGRNHAGAAGADRPGVPRPAENQAAAHARRRQQARYSASPRISRGCEAEGATPSRKTARRNGPIRSIR